MRDRPVFFGSELYRTSSYGGTHPLRVPRVSTVMDLSRALGWLPDHAYRRAPRARAKALCHWHDPDYIAALERVERTQTVSAADTQRFHLGTVSNPVFPEMFRRPATGAGASLLAGELLGLGQATVVYSPAGGTHHGLPGRANGFCYLNDVVLGLLSLRHHGVQRIAYIDIDAHHPDGVAHGFHGDPDMLMISVHEEDLWPRTGALMDTAGGAAVNLPVPRGLNDREMRHIRTRLILPLLEQFQPQAIVVQCGADAVVEDPLAHLCLSNNAHWDCIADIATCTSRLLVLGGGGYNPWSVGRLWTGVWATLNGFEIPDRLPDPAQEVLAALSFPGHSLGRAPPTHWFSTLRDAPREGPLRDEITERVALLRARHGLADRYALWP